MDNLSTSIILPGLYQNNSVYGGPKRLKEKSLFSIRLWVDQTNPKTVSEQLAENFKQIIYNFILSTYSGG